MTLSRTYLTAVSWSPGKIPDPEGGCVLTVDGSYPGGVDTTELFEDLFGAVPLPLELSSAVK